MYSLRQFGHMIRDPVRIDAFDRALAAAVQPGDVVIDIGTGTGIFALLACRYGARHVYAIDVNPLTEIGPAFATANGFADRITFIQGDSRSVSIPERADLVVGDIRGRLPGFQPAVDTFRDARERMLRPSGRILPEVDTVVVAAVSDAELYEQEVRSPWLVNDLSVDLSPAMPTIVNTMISTRLARDTELIGTQPWVVLDYVNGKLETVSESLSFTTTETASLHFIALWFDTVLFGDIGFSNAPGATSPEVYNQLLLPLAEPVELEAGDRLDVQLRADPASDDFIFTWSPTIVRADGTTVRLPRQSTFESLSLSGVMKRAHSYVPYMDDHGYAVARVLALFAEHRPVGEVAATIAAEFPSLAHSEQAALTFVADLSQRYSR